MHGRHSSMQEEHHQRLLPPACLALRPDSLRRRREQTQRLTLGVGVEPGDGASQCERLIPCKAEAFGHHCSPQREYWSTVNPKRMRCMPLVSHEIPSLRRLRLPAMALYALLPQGAARPHVNHSALYTTGANSMPGIEDSPGLRLVVFLDSPMSGCLWQ